MKLKIASENDAIAKVRRQPGELDVVSIRDPGHAIDFRDECQDLLVLEFHDACHDNGRFRADVTVPSRKHVSEAIEWCRERESVLFHCAGGVSRSSALAVVVACANGMPAAEAFSTVLNPMLHFPNPIIIGLGAEILGMPEIVEEAKKFEESAVRVFSDPED